ELADVPGRQSNAVGHARGAVLVVRAAARLAVEQLAGGPGEMDSRRLLFLELDEAAAAATVAERFPLVLTHLPQSLFFPEWQAVVHHDCAFRFAASTGRISKKRLLADSFATGECS